MTLIQSILSTLTYHDIFDYPLTKEEIRLLLINKKSTINHVRDSLNELLVKKLIGQDRGYYFLAKKQKIVKIRITREKYSKLKLRKAKFYSKLLQAIPQIKLVGISGALAMQNCTKNDDIDLVIITAKGRIWTARFLANLILWPFKRKPLSKDNSNKACLNLFLDEANLKLKDKNIYTAHEVAQMKVIWAKGNTYQKFINQNSWVKKYLPNWQGSSLANVRGLSLRYSRQGQSSNNSKIEKMLKHLQLKYMQKKITTEKISSKQLFFHPQNTQDKILNKFSNLTKEYTKPRIPANGLRKKLGTVKSRTQR